MIFVGGDKVARRERVFCGPLGVILVTTSSTATGNTDVAKTHWFCTISEIENVYLSYTSDNLSNAL